VRIKKSFLITSILIAGLYVVRADRVGGMNSYVKEMSALLDDNMLIGYMHPAESYNRLNQIAVLLNAAENDSFLAIDVIERSLRGRMSDSYIETVKLSLVENLRESQDMGLFSEENLATIAAGKTPAVSRGYHQGQKITFCQLLTDWEAPGVSRSFLNMRCIPLEMSEKGIPPEDKVKLAVSMSAASLIDEQTLNLVIRQARL
jgi:hypothetical protein